ncbi:MAG: molecular chaperone HtpG [Clostridia bacterium]|nr:molecular chaperone HtpG [Clostridia bacterium]
MRKKQFKAESKKLLDMMVNSIYTNREIFLRELISNASDALDKLYFRSLTDNTVLLSREEYEIRLIPDKQNRTLTVTDNGCGMTAEEMEENLGTIARSGSLDFKSENKDENVEIIGQFGVGFYSAFMVSSTVTVRSRKFGADCAFCWESEGAEGYTLTECEKDGFGTEIVLQLKEDTEQDKYSEFLDEYTLRHLVKKYSDYIRYPIRMQVSERVKKEDSDEYEEQLVDRTLNSMVPLWRKNKNEIEDGEYNAFYKDKFFDFTDPLRVIHTKTEGQATYDALLFIPARAPFDYYSKNYEKGLALYSNGVMITEKCADLLPDCFSFVKGLVDSADLSLNISREMLQQDHQLKLIAKTVEKKIKNELEKMLSGDREKYEEFWKTFGIQIKFGIYADYGMKKDELKDLVLFTSSNEKKQVTLKEYRERMGEEQKSIYYACGESVGLIEALPQLETVTGKGFEVLYLTDAVDEFALMTMQEYDGKKFVNICGDGLDVDTGEAGELVKAKNETEKELLAFLKETLGDSIGSVRFTDKLQKHLVCLTSEGAISVDMQKNLANAPGNDGIKATTVLEINVSHPIADKLVALHGEDKDLLAKYARILLGEARLIGGLTPEDPAAFAADLTSLMV